jgi:hypothetical protein
MPQIDTTTPEWLTYVEAFHVHRIACPGTSLERAALQDRDSKELTVMLQNPRCSLAQIQAVAHKWKEYLEYGLTR